MISASEALCSTIERQYIEHNEKVKHNMTFDEYLTWLRKRKVQIEVESKYSCAWNKDVPEFVNKEIEESAVIGKRYCTFTLTFTSSEYEGTVPEIDAKMMRDEFIDFLYDYGYEVEETEYITNRMGEYKRDPFLVDLTVTW